jgi:hypothetical protein
MSFAINKTAGNLTLKGGYLCIPKGGFAKVTEDDKKHQSLEYAATRKWLEYSEKAPTSVTVKPKQVFEKLPDTFAQGLTAEELKASRAAEPRKQPVTLGTVTAIGQGASGEEAAITVESQVSPVTTENADEPYVCEETEATAAKATRGRKKKS